MNLQLKQVIDHANEYNPKVFYHPGHGFYNDKSYYLISYTSDIIYDFIQEFQCKLHHHGYDSAVYGGGDIGILRNGDIFFLSVFVISMLFEIMLFSELDLAP